MFLIKMINFSHSDLQNQPSCAEASTGSEAAEHVQRNVTPLADIALKRPNTGMSV